jgi:hypothetical protein
MPISGLVRRTRFILGPCVLLFGALSAALPSRADTIIETGVGVNGPSVNAGQFESQGWTQTEAYDEASISVALYSWTPGSEFNITAYLTNTIGPLATSPAIATTSFSGETSDSTPQTFVLFSGLTLGPGTYFLTLSSSDNDGAEPGALWPTECAVGCPKALDSGVTLLSENFVNLSFGVEDSLYAPESSFMTAQNSALNFSLTDAPGLLNMPEPGTFSAAILGIAGLLAGFRFRNRDHSPR